MEVNCPPHEELKRNLAENFKPQLSYLGSHIKTVIMETDFKVLKRNSNPPSNIKKGDVFTTQFGTKSRPCVVIKVLRDRTVVYVPLTSTENVHCLTPYSSRFFGKGCFSRSISVCTEEYATTNFVGVFDNMKNLNEAIKELKQFLNKVL